MFMAFKSKLSTKNRSWQIIHSLNGENFDLLPSSNALRQISTISPFLLHSSWSLPLRVEELQLLNLCSLPLILQLVHYLEANKFPTITVWMKLFCLLFQRLLPWAFRSHASPGQSQLRSVQPRTRIGQSGGLRWGCHQTCHGKLSLIEQLFSHSDTFQLYFFTVEFGLCKQDGELKVYGAGLLSSVSELKHAIENSALKVKRFDPEATAKQECIITDFQLGYWYTDSFEEAKEKMRSELFADDSFNKKNWKCCCRTFAEQIRRPFGIRYNPYTQTVEVLSNAQKITAVVSELRGDLCIVNSALKKISARDATLDINQITTLLQTGLTMEENEEAKETKLDKSK